MKIGSLNVNNFGGLIEKPLLKDFKKKNRENDFGKWEEAVDEWRRQIDWQENVYRIYEFIKDMDIIALHEVDVGFNSYEVLEKMLTNHNVVVPMGYKKEDIKKSYNSISLIFVKKGIDYTRLKNPHERDLKASIIKVYLIQ